MVIPNLRGTLVELLPAEGRSCRRNALDLGVPLLHPRLLLSQPSDEGSEPLVVPAFLLPLLDNRRQRQCLLCIIPPSPTEQWRTVPVASRKRV